MICSRCHRQLKNDPRIIDDKPYGPVCARKVKKSKLSKMYPKLGEFF